MTKHLVDIDDADLDAARAALETGTVQETVARALREAAAAAAQRREIVRLTSGASSALADRGDRKRAWR